MPLINVSPPRFERFGADAVARTVAYLSGKLGPEVSIILRGGKIYLDLPINKIQGRTLGEAWRKELAVLAQHEPAPCPCKCGADLVLGECRSADTGAFLTADESSQIWDYAQCRYRGVEPGANATLIGVVKQVRIRTGLSLFDTHHRVMEVVEKMIEEIKGTVPGGLTVDEYRFIERTVMSPHNANWEPEGQAHSELVRLAVEVGQRIGLNAAFANVYAYAEFVRRGARVD